MKPSSLMNSIIKVHRQKGMNRACELTEGKISDGIDLANEGSPARLVDSMWEAGNKKSSYLDIKYNILITYCLT
jgi:hypothetical protein